MSFRVTHWTLRIATEPWEAKTRLTAELKRCAWNVSRTAKRLGVCRQTLYAWMATLRIQKPSAPELPPHSAIAA